MRLPTTAELKAEISPSALLEVPQTTFVYWTLGLAATLLSTVNDVSSSLVFLSWAVSDAGSTAALNDLLSAGLRPNVDFGYTYGPLSVLLGWAWSCVFGDSYISSIILLTILKLIASVALLHLFTRLRLPVLLSWIAAIGTIWYCPLGLVLASPAELVCVTFSLSQFLSERYHLALMWMTAALGFRPAAAFFGGISILIYLVVTGRPFSRNGIARLIRAIAPAAVVLVGIFALYTIRFGAESCLFTFLPLAGGAMYEEMSRASSDHSLLAPFFTMDGSRADFLKNTSWTNLLCLVLMVPGILASFGGGKKSLFGKRLLWGTVCLLIPSILFMYGGSEATVYSRYRTLFWISGVSSISILFPLARRPVTAVSVFLGFGLLIRSAAAIFGLILSTKANQVKHVPGTVLMMPGEAQRELLEISKLTGGRAVRVFEGMGDNTLFRYFGITTARNRYWCLRDGLNLPIEEERIRKDLADSEYILVSLEPNPHRDRYRDATATGFRVVHKGEFFEVLQKARTEPVETAERQLIGSLRIN